MGVNITEPVGPVPARAHGHKHWLDYTLDERPSEYHLVVRYNDVDGAYCGSAAITFNPGNIRSTLDKSAEDADADFAGIVALYEAGKTPDEMAVIIQSEGGQAFFDLAWESAQIVELPA
jgi:hypothetical protein